MAEQLDLATFTGAHPTNREFVAQLEVWGFSRRRVEGVHLVFRGPRGGTLRVLRSLLGRADAAQVAKAARLVEVDVARFWSGPARDEVATVAGADSGEVSAPRRRRASRDRITSLVLATHTEQDRPLGFEQVVQLCGGHLTREQVRHASSVLCRDGDLDRVRSGVYQWAGGDRARAAAASPARHERIPPDRGRVAPTPQWAGPATPSPLNTAGRSASAELFEQLFPRGLRTTVTAQLLADIDQWTQLTEKLAGYADASS
jgi:hypothetical protein